MLTVILTCYLLLLATDTNADLYAANQGSTELINEAHMEEAPLRFIFIFMGQDAAV